MIAGIEDNTKLYFLETATNLKWYTLLNSDDSVSLTTDASDPNIMKISMVNYPDLLEHNEYLAPISE